MRSPDEKKIVFVLGAGFSYEAGAPLQNQILPKIIALNDNNCKVVKEFIKYFFGHIDNIPLEDVFTALDRSISRDETLREKEIEHLIGVRESLNLAIATVVAESLSLPRADYVNHFAEVLLKLRLQDQKADKLAILSCNWDILVDNALGEFMEMDIPNAPDKKRRAYIDYCISDRQLNVDFQMPRSLSIKALGYYNVKLLKLHGSLNWLKCPNCDSLFVEFAAGKLAAKLQHHEYKCYVCRRNLELEINLRPFLISPTFLKDLTNVHSKMTWWNAGFELSEATHVVFIGYSLPPSDFEVRYLLARYLWKSAKIKVILFSNTPTVLEPKEKDERDRFTAFFGHRLRVDDISFWGADKYVKGLVGDPERLFW